MKKFRFVDLFCGGGGSITGAVRALRSVDYEYEGCGFDHWETAIRTVQANYPELIPDVSRSCVAIESIIPNEIFKIDPERIDVLWASPSCTHHSNAAGGIRRSNELRSQPEYILPFLQKTKCHRMFVENVPEMLDWGPLLDQDTVFKGKKYSTGNPDPTKKGMFFNQWLKEVCLSGYKVEFQILNAVDYGSASIRERLILQAVRKSSGDPIVWPEPTHTKNPGVLSGSYLPWRHASEVIDLTIPGKSIFNRKKPLCEKTMQRIESGIRKYSGKPFIITYYGSGQAIPIDIPLHTVTTRNHFALIQYNENKELTHRMLTTKELSDAMSFPDDYIFCGSDSDAKKQIGNAVPPVLAEALYRAVIEL